MEPKFGLVCSIYFQFCKIRMQLMIIRNYWLTTSTITKTIKWATQILASESSLPESEPLQWCHMMASEWQWPLPHTTQAPLTGNLWAGKHNSAGSILKSLLWTGENDGYSPNVNNEIEDWNKCLINIWQNKGFFKNRQYLSEILILKLIIVTLYEFGVQTKILPALVLWNLIAHSYFNL